MLGLEAELQSITVAVMPYVVGTAMIAGDTGLSV
jgi:hypothetical protein